MTEPVIWNVHDNVVLTTYGKQPCPHCCDRREFEGRVFWTMPRAITCGLAGISVAICATCVAEGEARRNMTEEDRAWAWIRADTEAAEQGL